MTPPVIESLVNLVEAMKLASNTWLLVCQDFDDPAAWVAHKRSQDLVHAARAVYTRAKADAYLQNRRAG